LKKKAIVSVGSLICVLAVLYFSARSCGTPPRDTKLVRQFYHHRSDFEKLRKMLQGDGSITGVAHYGIDTTHRNGVSPFTPEQIGFPRERYEEYLATLNKAGALLAAHNEGEFYFLIKRWGFAGNGWGIAVISRDTEPTNQVASLDDFRYTSNHFVYRHIDGSWYLWIKN
jgi:hypothetical protein